LGGAGTLAIVLIWAKLFPALRQVDELSAGGRRPASRRSP